MLDVAVDEVQLLKLPVKRPTKLLGIRKSRAEGFNILSRYISHCIKVIGPKKRNGIEMQIQCRWEASKGLEKIKRLNLEDDVP